MDSTTDTTTKHAHHNKTQKRVQTEDPPEDASKPTSGLSSAALPPEHFRNLLDESARDAFMRPWHKLERGLRLNRLRMYVEQIAPQCSFNQDEKSKFFDFLQRTHDRKLLNTHKIVNYIPEQQRIESIRGLEVRRAADGSAKWGFTMKKTKEMAGTRKKKKTDEVTTTAGAGAPTTSTT
jgi:hypothetical protein